MKPETYQAVLQSIAHWERLRDGVEGEKPTGDQCALCRRFSSNLCLDVSLDEKCPVALKSGSILCRNTPFVAAVKSPPETFPAAAQQMIDFLKTCLPSTEPLDFNNPPDYFPVNGPT